MSANPYDEKKTMAHVKEIADRTQEARNYFNLPENEKVIQDYACSRKLATGRLYVTQNYIGFRAALPKIIESISFRKIKSMEKVKLASISIKTEDGQEYDFGGFTQREEAFAILQHLHLNPPSYVMVDTSNDVAPKSPRITNNDGTMIELSLDNVGGQQQTSSKAKVDVASARSGVQKMYQARDMGLATLDELDRQREVVNGMEQRLENMDYDLDHNERHLRGIETIGGAIKNKMTKNTAQRKELQFETRERKIEAVKKRDLEVECLYKFANDKMVPSLLVFKEKVFVCADAAQKTKLVEKGAQWEYSEVKLVLIRARHQHLDVWFKTGGKEKRIRLMTAHVQWVTNEFSLRCGAELDVQWEPGAKKFDFGSVELASRPVPRGRANESTVGQKSKTAGLISKGAGAQVHADIAEQDAYLDEMSLGLDHLNAIAGVIGQEVVDSTSQIKRVNGKVDAVNNRIEAQNKRVEKQLKK